MSGLAQFPLLGSVNEIRYSLFQITHDLPTIPATGPEPVSTKTVSWLGHKVLSVVCLPANALATGLGATGMALTAATLGTFKVAVFALTLGSIRPEFSIGFLWLGERTITSIVELLSNVGEIGYDAANLVYQGYKGVRFVLTALKLDYLSNLLRRAVDVALDRVYVGMHYAQSDEAHFPLHTLMPSQIEAFDKATHESSCLKTADQSIGRWVEHKLLSLINIPVNGVLFAASAVGYVGELALVASKVAFFVLTNIRVQVPIGYDKVGDVALMSGINVLRNGLEVILDVGLPVYKLASALHLTRVAATIRDLGVYTLTAIFS